VGWLCCSYHGVDWSGDLSYNARLAHGDAGTIVALLAKNWSCAVFALEETAIVRMCNGARLPELK
jgi:hypothetical protein